MAIDEHDREDLLHDGRMMPVRGETTIGDVVVLIGFRRQGQLSLYFGSNQVFQFDSEQRLRRVYLDGYRYAAQRGQLVGLTRESRGGRVELIRQVVDRDTSQRVIDALSGCLAQAQAAVDVDVDRWDVMGADASAFATQVAEWFASLPKPVQFAAGPGA